MFNASVWFFIYIEALRSQKVSRRTFQTLSVTNSSAVRSILLRGLKDTSERKSLEDGKQIHDEVIQSGLSEDEIMSSAIVNMYINCGNLADACKAFQHVHITNVAAWNVMIEGYSKCSLYKEAISLFWRLKKSGIKPTKITYLNVLKACTESESLEEGTAVHKALTEDIKSDIFLDSVLIGMYAKCGCIDKGRQLFDKMRERDVVAWNVIIGGYAESGKIDEAIYLFKEMQKQLVLPDSITYVNLLKACTNAVSLEVGQDVHSHMVKCGVSISVFYGSSLVDMYVKCGSVRDAQVVFDTLPSRDVVLYNVMIAGYAQERLGLEAFKLLSKIESEGMQPDRVTFLCLLKVCIGMSSLDLGKHVHLHIILHGYGLDTKVMNTVIDMYAKCGGIVQARQVFDIIPKNSVVTWTAMIGCYVHHRQFQEAFDLFWKMQAENLQLNEGAYVTILKACAQTGALDQGLKVHKLIRKTGFLSTILVESALIDMYCKCGSVKRARRVFDHMAQHDAISWTSMLTGYAQHGYGAEALEITNKMLEGGFKLDRITALAILSACNHIGQVDEALCFFYSMAEGYGMIPSAEHYACMVDLLGKAGHLDEVGDLLNKMPRQPNAMAWTASLGACGVHGNMELAKFISESLHSVEPRSTAAFVLLSNVCAQSKIEDNILIQRYLGEIETLTDDTAYTYS